jgi:hypothetical protein
VRFKPEIHRVDPEFGSTLKALIGIFQSNCWVNLRILGQPCGFYLSVTNCLPLVRSKPRLITTVTVDKKLVEMLSGVQTINAPCFALESLPAPLITQKTCAGDLQIWLFHVGNFAGA